MRTRVMIAACAIAAAAALFFVLGPDKRDVTNHPPRSRAVVAFGDSLVQGVGASKGADFPSLVSRELGISVANLGRSGDTTAAGLARIDEALARNPGVTIVLLGGNDFLRRVPKAETFANLSRIIERIHSSGSVVLLVGIRGGIIGDGYEEGFEDLVRRHNVAYVPDILDGIIGHSALMSDAIHPNDTGYAIMAERIGDELAKLIGEGI